MQQVFLNMCGILRLRYTICAGMRERAVQIYHSRQKQKNNTSSSGTQQLGDRGRDARVSDGYLPLTVAVERCQMSTHSKRICNANESARVPSVCSNLCRTHNVLASSPLWPKVTLWTVSKGMSVCLQVMKHKIPWSHCYKCGTTPERRRDRTTGEAYTGQLQKAKWFTASPVGLIIQNNSCHGSFILYCGKSLVSVLV